MTDSRSRVHLAVTQAVMDRLNRIKALTEAESTTEVVRRALACYEDLANVFCMGGKIMLHPKDEEPRELTPIWTSKIEFEVAKKLALRDLCTLFGAGSYEKGREVLLQFLTREGQ